MSTYARDERVSSIRKKGIIYMVLAVLAYFADFIPVLGGLFEFVIKIVAFIFLFLAVKGFAELSGSETIVKKIHHFCYFFTAWFSYFVLQDKSCVLGFWNCFSHNYLYPAYLVINLRLHAL